MARGKAAVPEEHDAGAKVGVAEAEAAVFGEVVVGDVLLHQGQGRREKNALAGGVGDADVEAALPEQPDAHFFPAQAKGRGCPKAMFDGLAKAHRRQGRVASGAGPTGLGGATEKQAFEGKEGQGDGEQTAHSKEGLRPKRGRGDVAFRRTLVEATVRRLLGATWGPVASVRETRRGGRSLRAMPGPMGFGRGKVILLGEHSVVYGHPALAAGLNRGVKAQARENSETLLHCHPWNLTVSPGNDGPLDRAFAAVLASYPEGKVRVDADVKLPGGAGLGCSAALGVAVVDALDAHFGVHRTPEERGAFSLTWEKEFHGNPSGVDNTMAACGGVAVFRRGQALKPVAMKAPIHLVVAHSGESSSTKLVVAGLAERREADPEGVGARFAAIESLVLQAQMALEDGQVDALGAAMNGNQVFLRELGLSTEKLDTLCWEAMAEGSLGAKLTGAGAGGCMIALAKSQEHAQAIEARLKPMASFTLVTAAGG